MKEKNQVREEKVFVININLTRGLAVLLVVAMLLAAFVGYLAWDQEEVAASAPQAPLAASTGMRQYYLTQNTYEGNESAGTDGKGAGVCTAGYHFASMWELLDPSNLKYNTDLGFTRDDSGQGPPSSGSGIYGWVRTGNASSNSSTPGTGNCSNWTSNSIATSGSVAILDSSWDTAGNFPGWVVGFRACGSTITRVWCVED